MNCLVTGGAGFIGSNLVDALLADGHGVTVLDDLSSGYGENLAHLRGREGFRFLEGDVRDEALLAQAARGQEAVFHLAASVGNKRSIDNPLTDADINVLGTLKVLEAARSAGCRKVVFSSSAGIFGELKTLPIAEDHPVEPDSPYGCTKLCAEKLCLAYAKLYDLEAVALRYFNVYGPRQRFDAYGNVIPIFVFQILRGEPITVFGDGEQTRDFVHVRDVVQANVKAALSREVSGAFNIASGTRITLNDLVDLLRETGLSPKVLSGPPRPGDVRHSLADLRQARTLLGFEPRVDLREGLKEYVAWAREEAAR
ncbi:NAD-dependent epimerase/dehydratase [Aminomonas paucivorans DSM 12260]|uniref:NAD-dependent epimerase/dehydratase n=1 Tax=Aminomonas paucivorans DSM 12260 TaxID=584708 RepID=E3CVM1_9BACT|nr:SDR family oxidoreductase [Aminomonas paucivorans]EFQ24212.1 NAD-dependent epimerase/dehydratase [Aminomonas paucivorans DSM 12260]